MPDLRWHQTYCRRQLFPLYISQDGAVPKPKVADLAKSLNVQGISYLHHHEDMPPEPLTSKRENLAYYRIANHYKFLMQTFFDCFGYSRLIILEASISDSPPEAKLFSWRCWESVPVLIFCAIHECDPSQFNTHKAIASWCFKLTHQVTLSTIA